MKKIILYILILLVTLWIPINRMDISNLEPVQAIGIYKNGSQYIIVTDTQAVGAGESINQAVDSLKQKCEKIVYLDTAQYLLVSEKCRDAIDDMSVYLKKNVKVGFWNGGEDLTKVAQYMQSHRIGIKMKEYSDNLKLPRILGKN